ncbi:hypothetical protein L2E82_38239 [Cichorium intybus]|uniref:Uncharacterized protein n=1 Tax=Cichorium intybus TaxID=13427 RepID=A0ACB9AF14_CICIN|nr:hypothetical protein L2E82_38239 [Cichorium intybus]
MKVHLRRQGKNKKEGARTKSNKQVHQDDEVQSEGVPNGGVQSEGVPDGAVQLDGVPIDEVQSDGVPVEDMNAEVETEGTYLDVCYTDKL